MSGYKDKLRSMKNPDVFQRWGYQFLDSFAKHRSLYLGIAVAIVVLIVGLFVVTNVVKRLAVDRRNDLALVDNIYEKEEKSANEQRQEFYKKVTELKADLAKYKEESKKKAKDKSLADFDPVATNKRISKIEAAIKEVKPDHSKSLQQYLDFYRPR